MKHPLFLLLLFAYFGVSKAQEPLSERNSALLMQIFGSGSERFFDVISQPEKYKYQVIYTQIDRNKHGIPRLIHHYFNYSDKQFLYPASLVKLPACLLALQKVNELAYKGVLPYTAMLTDSADYCQTQALYDYTQKDKRPSVDGYIKKMMLVSDNDAYNRIYEFLGSDYIYENLKARGLGDVRIVQRFSAKCDSTSYYFTNPIVFLEGRDTLYKQPAVMGKYRLHNPLGEVFMGKGYYDFSNYYNPFPRSFYYNNHISMRDLQHVLEAIFFPETMEKSKRFNVPESYMNILKTYMGQYPVESHYPSYSLPRNFKKYFLIGDGSPLPGNADVRIFNVVGRAYGVLADCAYIVDFKNRTEFMLTAIMYCNEDDILNDNTYEYDSVGLPFFAELGKMIYRYELKRNRRYAFDPSDLEKLFD